MADPTGTHAHASHATSPSSLLPPPIGCAARRSRHRLRAAVRLFRHVRLHAQPGRRAPVRSRRFRERQHPHPPHQCAQGPGLRSRAPGSAEPGLPGEHRHRRVGGGPQVFPALRRYPLRSGDARGLRARRARRPAHRRLRQRAAGPLRHQEDQQLRIAGRRRAGLAVAARVRIGRHPGQGGQRDRQRQALLRTFFELFGRFVQPPPAPAPESATPMLVRPQPQLQERSLPAAQPVQPAQPAGPVSAADPAAAAPAAAPPASPATASGTADMPLPALATPAWPADSAATSPAAATARP